MAVAIVCFLTFNIIGSTVDASGVLHESFGFLATGWILTLISAAYALVVSALSLRKGPTIYDKLVLAVCGAFLIFLITGTAYKNLNSPYVNTNASTTQNTATNVNINTNANSNTNTQLANPASTNCAEKGGKLVINKMGNGGEYGLCYFDDNRACEEWAMYRGDCPVGGRRTTGYDTIDQNFCAWTGGETFAVANSVCTFKNGKTCPTIDYYNGTCTQF